MADGFGGAGGFGGGNPLQGDLYNIGYGLFGGDAGKPYEQASGQLNDWFQKAYGYQQPFLQAGQGAIGPYQQWLQGMQDPSGFINKLMGGYQESPWAKYQQQQGIRAAQNAGSAGGMTGSTPLAQFMAQQAEGISSQDMQNWLQRVLGINSLYGQGYNNLMGYGANAANSLTGLAGQYGQDQAAMAAAQEQARQQQQGGLWGGLLGLFTGNGQFGMGGQQGWGGQGITGNAIGQAIAGAL